MNVPYTSKPREVIPTPEFHLSRTSYPTERDYNKMYESRSDVESGTYAVQLGGWILKDGKYGEYLQFHFHVLNAFPSRLICYNSPPIFYRESRLLLLTEALLGRKLIHKEKINLRSLVGLTCTLHAERTTVKPSKYKSYRYYEYEVVAVPQLNEGGVCQD